MAGTVARHWMFRPGEKVLAAFSGGADSTALVVLLQSLGHDVVAGHVDHGMRGDSDRDAAHCRAVAKRLGIELQVRKVVVDPPTQAEARRVRYLALEEMAGAAGAAKLATGHTLDDQAETVTMRLERGGYGLGIPPVRGRIVRPLLDLRRRDTEQVCRDAGVEFCTDPSNSNPKYRRVVVRERLAGASQAQIYGLIEVADAARRESREVSRRVDQLWPSVVSAAEGEVRVLRAGLKLMDPKIRLQLLRRAVSLSGVEPTGRALQDVVRKVLAVTGARLELASGLSVWSEREYLVIGRFSDHALLPATPLAASGVTRLDDWQLQVRVEPVTGASDVISSSDRSTEMVDMALLDQPLVVRQWQAGDRFHPLGAPGTRKLQDFFVDAGVPRAARMRVPIVVCGSRIVWVAGHRLDDRFKLRRTTTAVARLSISPLTESRVA